MAYRIRSGEPVDEAVRRICLEQLGRAAGELTGTEVDVNEAVHQVRKRFKKIRAVLRLVRPALGEAYAAENAWFRDEARKLSLFRDAEALVETVDRLGKTFAEQVEEGFVERVREALVERRAGLAGDHVDPWRRVEDLVAGLDDARDRVAGWALGAGGFDAIGPGFAKTYARGRAAFAAVMSAPTGENVHELRKRVKYHRYQVRMLVPVWPRLLRAYLRELHELTDLLGENQDLRVLRETLTAEPDLLGRGRDEQVLLGLLERRQAELHSLIEPLALRAFAEKPKAATARVGAYWQAWVRGEGQGQVDVVEEAR